MRRTPGISALIGVGLALALPSVARAQETPPAPKPGLVTMELRDAPLRATLEQLFERAGVQYSLNGAMPGFVTMKLQDQPFETALTLILRAAPVPLTFAVEDGVYLVQPRKAPLPATVTVDAPPAPASAPARVWERIELVHIDPMDLAAALGLNVLIRNFSRMTGAAGGGFSGRAPGAGNGFGQPLRGGSTTLGGMIFPGNGAPLGGSGTGGR